MTALTLRKNLAPLKAAAIARVNTLCGAARARYITVIPGQDMVYLEKAAEARRYLTDFPTPEDEPETLDPDPVLGFPFIAAEIGTTASTAYGVATVYVTGAALFRQVGAAIETIRLGAVAAIEGATVPAMLDAAEVGVAAALALLPGAG
jgi:hypothetical protein